ncbi:hypothetical protein V8E36_000933 [Tilletia maclaganii]
MVRPDSHYRRGPSVHSPTSHYLALAVDGFGAGPSSYTTPNRGGPSAFPAGPSTNRAAGSVEAYTFPPLFLDPERALAHEAEFGNPDEHSARWALPALQYEMIAVPEGLIPPAIDSDADVLPSEQHPSFPYGNPFASISAQVNTPFASRPLLDPKLHLNLELAHAAEARTRARNEDPPLDEAFTNFNPAGMAGQGISLSAGSADGGGPSTQDHVLAHHLQLRAATATGPTNPHWPFKRFGPGRIGSATPSGGAGALLRAERERVQLPTREIWADLALESLLPRGKVIPFQHPVANPNGTAAMRSNPIADRAEGDPLAAGLQAPDQVGIAYPGLPTSSRLPGTVPTPGSRPASTLREDYLNSPSSTATPPTGTVEERLSRAMALTGVRDYVDAAGAGAAARHTASLHRGIGGGSSSAGQTPPLPPNPAGVRQAAARMRGVVSRAHRQQQQHLRPGEAEGSAPWPAVVPQPQPQPQPPL